MYVNSLDQFSLGGLFVCLFLVFYVFYALVLSDRWERFSLVFSALLWTLFTRKPYIRSCVICSLLSALALIRRFRYPFLPGQTTTKLTAPLPPPCVIRGTPLTLASKPQDTRYS